MAFLEIEGINTFYGVFQALFDVSLRLEEGEAVCLLGRNGAGKTTTLSSIVGLNSPRSGSITFKGTNVTGKRPYEIARLGVGFAPENRLIFQDLTVRDNLELGCRKKQRSELVGALDKVYHLFPRLKNLEDRQGGTLSGGEQQMLTIARALMGNPDLLLLDELTTGLAPIVIQLLKTQITQLKQEKLTILLTEQNALFALDISDRVYVIDKGTIVYDGSVEGLRQDLDLMRQYLGV
ncbi:MAG: ABC transporter ATP-binding protein [Desulfomonile tiedjei]|jgi:branched-chain amino acid transport system ATP-binding protein|nr:ABC transporter ATP-binding protein [Desulfomonile tiedjei]